MNLKNHRKIESGKIFNAYFEACRNNKTSEVDLIKTLPFGNGEREVCYRTFMWNGKIFVVTEYDHFNGHMSNFEDPYDVFGLRIAEVINTEGESFDHLRKINNIKRDVELLRDACINNSYKCAKLLIDNGVDVNYKIEWNPDQSDENNLLILSCISNSYDCAKLLIDNGVDVNYKNRSGSTALHEACRINAYECAKLLIDNGANVNNKDNVERSILNDTCKNNLFECAKLLIENGAKLNIQDKQGNTELFNAFINKSYKCAKLLIDNGADTTIKDNNGESVKDLSDRGIFKNRIQTINQITL